VKPFLKELAERIVGDKITPGDLTVVFPNRRAILYFRKYLSEIIDKPVFSPQLLTVEDFMASFTSLRVPDKLELVHHLHAVYKSVVNVDEPFDKFYFWGEMLLKDFDEIDRYRRVFTGRDPLTPRAWWSAGTYHIQFPDGQVRAVAQPPVPVVPVPVPAAWSPNPGAPSGAAP